MPFGNLSVLRPVDDYAQSHRAIVCQRRGQVYSRGDDRDVEAPRVVVESWRGSSLPKGLRL